VLTATNFAGSGVATDIVIVYSPPGAAFTHSGPDWLGQTTAFTDTTATTPPGDPTVTYLWAFGDGLTSTLENHTHTYTLPGFHTVVLTVANAAGSDVATDTVTVYSAPAVTFTTSSPDWLGQATFFTATITTTPPADPSVSLTWNFGDETVQAGPETVSHTYTAPGTYTVVLTATNLAGQDVATSTVVIYGLPVADFTTSSPDWLGQTTVFTNTTATTPPGDPTVTYLWSFGDGVTSTQASPTHTYATASLYTVTLTTTNPAGSDVATDTVTVYSPPTVDFTACPTDGFRSLPVAFTATVTTMPPGDLTLAYRWAFGDGVTSTLPSPTHTYTRAGSYTATLTVSNAAGSNAVIRTNYVTVYEPVLAGFTASPRYGISPLAVYFTDTSSGPVAVWEWTFGNGGISILQHPTYTYTTAGVYTIGLTVRAAGGSALWPGGTDTLTRTHFITVHEPVQAAFTASPTSGVAPLTVVFTSTSTGDYITSLWDFGDGITDTQTNPTHTYMIGGLYPVTLPVSGLGGTDTLTRTHFITVYTPVQADFVASPTSGAPPLTVVFTNTSSGDYAASLWDFGDSITSTLLNPPHIYMAAGVYTVTLTMSGPGGSDTETKVGYISVEHKVYLPLALR